MSSIDKLIISVGIDEGTKLDELHSMLKELEASGGKLEIQIPDMITKGQFKGMGDRISNLSKFIKTTVEKFPEIQQSLEKMLNDLVVDNLNEILSIVNKSLKEGLGNDIKTLLRDIEKQISREQILGILELVKYVKGQLQTVQPRLALQMRREFATVGLDKIGGTLEFLEEFKTSLESLLEIKVNDLSETLSLINDGMIDFKSRIYDLSKSLENLKLKNPELDNIKEQLDKMHVDILHAAKNDMLILIRDLLMDMQTSFGAGVKDFNNTFWNTWMTEQNMSTRLDRAIELREQARDKVADEVGVQLDKFKTKLDTNLEKIIPTIIKPELNDFLDAAAAIMSGRGEEKGFESVWKAPGVKAIGEKGYFESLSGFFRQLVSQMLTMKPESLMGMRDWMISKGGIGRTLESVKSGKELRQLEDFFGIQLDSQKTVKELLTQILEKIAKSEIKAEDIIGGINGIDNKLTETNVEQKNLNNDLKVKGK